VQRNDGMGGRYTGGPAPEELLHLTISFHYGNLTTYAVLDDGADPVTGYCSEGGCILLEGGLRHYYTIVT